MTHHKVTLFQITRAKGRKFAKQSKKLLLSLASYPGQLVPDALQRTAFVVGHPPMSKGYLCYQEGDADAEADGDTTLGMESQAVSEIEEAADD